MSPLPHLARGGCRDAFRCSPEQHVRITVERRRNNVVPLIFVAVAVFVVLRLEIGPWVMAAALLGLLPH